MEMAHRFMLSGIQANSCKPVFLSEKKNDLKKQKKRLKKKTKKTIGKKGQKRRFEQAKTKAKKKNK